MTDAHDLAAADSSLAQALSELAATLPPQGVCEVCREADESVGRTYCEDLPLMQLCESCHWSTCPKGGSCT